MSEKRKRSFIEKFEFSKDLAEQIQFTLNLFKK